MNSWIGSDRMKAEKDWFHLRMGGTYCSQTQLDYIAYEQTIICGQLFAGQVMCSRPTKTKKNLH